MTLHDCLNYEDGEYGRPPGGEGGTGLPLPHFAEPCLDTHPKQANQPYSPVVSLQLSVPRAQPWAAGMGALVIFAGLLGPPAVAMAPRAATVAVSSLPLPHEIAL